jgi:hypothetical protein
MRMACGRLPNEGDVDNRLPDSDADCEGCDGSGIRCPAEPSCALAELPVGWVVVERCDLCARYADDLSAACVVCDRSRWVRCTSGGIHAVGYVTTKR